MKLALDEKINKGSITLAFFLISALILISFLLSSYVSLAATSEEETTGSNVTVTKQVAISKSNNLTAGIIFGPPSDSGCGTNGCDPGSNYLNATGNFNSTNQAQIWLTMDSTTNTPIDICIKDNEALKVGSTSNTIANTEYHWNDSTTNIGNTANPLYPATTDISTTYQYADAFNDTPSGTTTPFYFRFSLDIPSSTKAGTYNNTVYFKATENITAC